MAGRTRLFRTARAGVVAGIAGGALAGLGRVALRARRRRRAERSAARAESRGWPAVPSRAGPVVISAPKAEQSARPDDAA